MIHYPFSHPRGRWLEVWVDSALLAENQRWCINRTKHAEARIRRLVHKHGVPPTSARNLQKDIIQGTQLYASELSWRGGDARGPGEKSMEKGYQKIINQIGRATTGTFCSTPLGIVLAESKLAPAEPPLDYRQEILTQRFMARPKEHHGPEEVLKRRGTRLSERLRQRAFLGPKERQGEIEWSRHRRFRGKIVVDPSGEAFWVARGWRDKKNTIWTDGSRMEDRWMGAAAI